MTPERYWAAFALFHLALAAGVLAVARMRIADVASVHALLQGLAEIAARPHAAEVVANEDPILADTTAH